MVNQIVFDRPLCFFSSYVYRLNQIVIGKLLGRLGLRDIHVAANGLVATQLCSSHHYDLILMDINVCFNFFFFVCLFVPSRQLA